MKSRKTITCIMMRPEGIYQKRIMEGLQAQCEHYDYNLAVFCPLVDITHYNKEYLNADMNIINLPDFRSFDAVVLVSVSLTPYNDETLVNEYVKKIRQQSDLPIISLDQDVDGCISMHTDDVSAFFDITSHLINCHKCRKIYILTGYEGNVISEKRVKGYSEAMVHHGLEVKKENIFYGDFWYNSGEALANRIISGEVDFPDAVVCGGDHMAIGLANRLISEGIKIPEQIIVAGYDGSLEAVSNPTSITSYTPDVSGMAAKAVTAIRTIIEPEKPVSEASLTNVCGLVIGDSCGCKVDVRMQKRYMQTAMYHANRNYGDDNIVNMENLSTLIENYMLENLTEAESPIDCLKQIYRFTYLITPYDHFYLCLKPDWADSDECLKEGYPDTMRCVMHAIPEDSPEREIYDIHCRNDEINDFPTSRMLPELWEHFDKPSVFYFAPCHFSTNTLGYSVYQCYLERRAKLSIVYQSWLRNVNSALEMARARYKLICSSLVDSMTHQWNRRGLSIKIKDLLELKGPGDKMLAIVVDMDGLKTINDTYGHNEGDSAILTIASAVNTMTEKGEACARAGGDEFYILGMGKYTEEGVQKRVERFYEILEERMKSDPRPYKLSASVGFSIMPVTDRTDVTHLIAQADEKMYICKAEHKKTL